jgi:ferredoxin
VGDFYCDGLGACIGSCPRGAIKIIEREAEPYDERKVMERLVKEGRGMIKAHLQHLKEHGKEDYLKKAVDYLKEMGIRISLDKKLKQWPIQLALVPANAPYFDGADLLVSADCVPFAYTNFHQDFLKNKSLVIGCPKLDDTESYKEKLTEILRSNSIKKITVVHMEVPCCFGLQHLVEEVVRNSGKKVKMIQKVISIDGKVVSDHS